MFNEFLNFQLIFNTLLIFLQNFEFSRQILIFKVVFEFSRNFQILNQILKFMKFSLF